MADDLVLERVENLEKSLESLATLPGEVAGLKDRVGGLELQFLQLRAEMTEQFSAVRADLRVELTATRNDILEIIESGSQATGEMFKETWAQIRSLHVQMRMLHEDVIERIKHIGEGPH